MQALHIVNELHFVDIRLLSFFFYLALWQVLALEIQRSELRWVGPQVLELITADSDGQVLEW